ncbi:hypothetical protein MY4038_004687 [Beauveria bassiana]
MLVSTEPGSRAAGSKSQTTSQNSKSARNIARMTSGPLTSVAEQLLADAKLRDAYAEANGLDAATFSKDSLSEFPLGMEEIRYSIIDQAQNLKRLAQGPRDLELIPSKVTKTELAAATMSLTARISVQNEDACNDPEDVFASALGTIFPDDVMNLHGDPGQTLVYKSPHLSGPLLLKLCEPLQETDKTLFSHHLWNSSLMLAEMIEADTLNIPLGTEPRIKNDARCNVKGRRVIEFGAGAGLAGIIAGLVGAQRVAVTDYPSETLLEPLRGNISRCVNPILAPPGVAPGADVFVKGHGWGELTNDFSVREKHAFDCVVAADVLWMPWQHDNLRKSIEHFLSHQADARCWLIAGLHTGRAKVAMFFDVAELKNFGLEIEFIWERDCNGLEREWKEERYDDSQYKKRWLILGVLKRIKK